MCSILSQQGPAPHSPHPPTAAPSVSTGGSFFPGDPVRQAGQRGRLGKLRFSPAKGQRGSEPSWARSVQLADPDWAQRALRAGAEVGRACRGSNRPMKQKPGRGAAALLALPGLSGLSSFRQPLPCPARHSQPRANVAPACKGTRPQTQPASTRHGGRQACRLGRQRLHWGHRMPPCPGDTRAQMQPRTGSCP